MGCEANRNIGRKQSTRVFLVPILSKRTFYTLPRCIANYSICPRFAFFFWGGGRGMEVFSWTFSPLSSNFKGQLARPTRNIKRSGNQIRRIHFILNRIRPLRLTLFLRKFEGTANSFLPGKQKRLSAIEQLIKWQHVAASFTGTIPTYGMWS